MKFKIYIPVIDTESRKFEFKGKLTVEEFRKAELKWWNNAAFGKYGSNRVAKADKDTTLLFRHSEAEAFITNKDDNDIDKGFFLTRLDNNDEKMFIINMNINPDSVDMDAKEELEFWINDCKNVLIDKTLDWKTKMEALPQMSFDLYIDNGVALLQGCKLLKLYNKKVIDSYGREKTTNPYKFAIIVEKIIWLKKEK